jgi:hypothetical protein
MPGSPTAPGRTGARIVASVRIAFRQRNSVGTRDDPTFAAQWLAFAIPCRRFASVLANADARAQWLAYAIPCRRFASVLANADARLGADVVCYSFIAVDLHHLLLAGLPAHSALGLGCVRTRW